MKKIVEAILTLISRIIPTNSKLIVLESNPNFSDNTGAFCETLFSLGADKKYKIIWFVFKDGAGKSLKESMEGYNVKYVYLDFGNKLNKLFSYMKAQYYLMRSAFFFFSHRSIVFFKPKTNQRVVNFTHGVSLKDTSGRNGNQKFVTDIISLSNFSSVLLEKNLQVDNSKMNVLGYPRNDLLKKRKSYFEGETRTMVWLPTYRVHKDTLPSNQSEVFPLSPSAEDFQLLDQMLIKNNIKLVIKPHPAQKLDLAFSNYSNICEITDDDLLRHGDHLYDLLSNSCMLITDYSSVYVDYLLTNKPILFTFDDFDEYKKDWNFLVDNVLELSPGEKIYSMRDLIDNIDRIIVRGVDLYSDERVRVKNIFHFYDDNQSSQRIIDYFDIK